MADAFDRLSSRRNQVPEVQESPEVQNEQSVPPSKSKDAFDKINPVKNDSTSKSALRTLFQPITGALQLSKISMVLDLAKQMAIGDALDPEEIENIRMVSFREGIPFDEDKYREAVSNAADNFITQGNFEKMAEEAMGVPLESKTKLQKGLKLAGSAGKGAGGSLLQRSTAALAAPSISQGLQYAGVPEPISDILGLGGSSMAASKAPTSIKRTPVAKPSGLPEKNFEKLYGRRIVSPKKSEMILEGIEEDFREISNKIEDVSPISKIKNAVILNPNFDQNLDKRFKNVEKLSEILPNRVRQQNIRKALIHSSKNKDMKGLAPSEYEKGLKKFTLQHAKDLKLKKKDIGKELGLNKLVEQFRKNNEARSAAYEPGKAYSFNAAKKDALGEYNNILADKIYQSDPALGKMFLDANKKYSQRSDLLAMEEYVDRIFPEGQKIDFKFAKEILKDKNMSLPFKRSLGDNFPKFEKLIEDLSSYQKSLKNIKIAQNAGMSDVVSSAVPYLISPTFGKSVTSIKGFNKAYKLMRNITLDKNYHKYIPIWDKGVSAFQKGDFKTAAAMFSKLDAERKDKD